jgi:hypothetical protein
MPESDHWRLIIVSGSFALEADPPRFLCGERRDK